MNLLLTSSLKIRDVETSFVQPFALPSRLGCDSRLTRDYSFILAPEFFSVLHAELT